MPLAALEIGDVLVSSAEFLYEKRKPTLLPDVADFFVIQGNIDNAVTSDGSSSVVSSLPMYADDSGKLLTGSLVTVSEDGSLDIPAGETYNIDGEAHNHNFDDLVDVVAAGITLDEVIAKADKYQATFVNLDWEGEAAPYTITVLQNAHKLQTVSSVMVIDASKDLVSTGVNIDKDLTEGHTVVLSSMVKFAGKYSFVG